MMTKRELLLRNQRTQLKRHNWDVRKHDSIRFNAGSETTKHVVGKAISALVLKHHGYRIDSEVTCPGGEVDILGVSEEDIIVVELETSPTREVVESKLERYVKGQPPREMFLINLKELPVDMIEAYDFIENEIFQ